MAVPVKHKGVNNWYVWHLSGDDSDREASKWFYHPHLDYSQNFTNSDGYQNTELEEASNQGQVD